MKHSSYILISGTLLVVFVAGGFVFVKFFSRATGTQTLKPSSTAARDLPKEPQSLGQGSVQGASAINNLAQGADTKNIQSMPVSSPQNPVPDNTQPAPPLAPKKFTTSEGLIIEILQEGQGDLLTKAGDKIVVNYVGTLDDGTKFDSSLDRKQAFAFTLGEGQVIKGWDQGLGSMKVNEIRRLTIPPSLAYGASGTPGGPIPPNAILHFDVQLLQIN